MAVIHENDGCVASWETDGCKVPMRLFRWGGGQGRGVVRLACPCFNRNALLGLLAASRPLLLAHEADGGLRELHVRRIARAREPRARPCVGNVRRYSCRRNAVIRQPRRQLGIGSAGSGAGTGSRDGYLGPETERPEIRIGRWDRKSGSEVGIGRLDRGGALLSPWSR